LRSYCRSRVCRFDVALHGGGRINATSRTVANNLAPGGQSGMSAPCQLSGDCVAKVVLYWRSKILGPVGAAFV
jgi:hypothetical protein